MQIGEEQPPPKTTATATTMSRFYSDAHPLSPQGVPPTRVMAGHPANLRRSPAVSSFGAGSPAAIYSRPASRKSWDSTNTDLSRYSLTEEERIRRKAILRSPVDTGNHGGVRRRSKGRKAFAKKKNKMKKQKPKASSSAASPGAASGPNPMRTPTRSRSALETPSHPTKRAWVPSGKTAGKGLVERKPGFIDTSWQLYVDDEEDDSVIPSDGEELHVTSPSSLNSYKLSDIAADSSRARKLKSSTERRAGASSTPVSIRKSTGTTMSLYETSKKWKQRKEAIEAQIAKAESDIFTQDAADAMRALRSTSTPGARVGRKQASFLKKRVAATPAATELGRRRRAEQEAALIELGAQITRLRIIRGVDEELPPEQEHADTTVKLSEDNAVGHWMHFSASSLSSTLSGDLSSPYKDAHVMISSLAKVASSLASSLAESEIRLQEAEKEARLSREALIDVSTELEQVRSARDVDAETISRLVTQIPDIALMDYRSSAQQHNYGEVAGNQQSPDEGDLTSEEAKSLVDVDDDANLDACLEIMDNADAIAAAAPFDSVTAKQFESENLGISGKAMQILHAPTEDDALYATEREDTLSAEEEPAEAPPAPVPAPVQASMATSQASTQPSTQTQVSVEEELTPRTAPQPVAKSSPGRGIFMPSVQFNNNVNTKPLGKLDFKEYMNSAAAWRAQNFHQ